MKKTAHPLMWFTASAGLNVASFISVRPSGGFVEHLCSVREKRHLPVANHFNSPSHSLNDMSILRLLQCHNDATWKLKEQY
eukprot:g44924.t1